MKITQEELKEIANELLYKDNPPIDSLKEHYNDGVRDLAERLAQFCDDKS